MTTALQVSQLPAQYEIRPLETTAELVESFRLRYEIYQSIGYLQQHNASALEIDEYDRYSIPFVAVELSTRRVIGTLRLITDEVQAEYEPLIDQVIQEAGDAALTAQAGWARREPPTPVLPSIVSAATADRLAAYNHDQLAVGELSRGIVAPAYRSQGVRRALMKLGLAYAARRGPAIVIAGCMPEHVALNAWYGFQILPGTDLHRFESVGQTANTIVCRTDALPDTVGHDVDDLVSAMTSGLWDHALEIQRGVRAVFPVSAPRRARRSTMEW